MLLDMSNQPDRLWSEEEKYALLTEILKSAGISSNYLVRIINDFRIEPNWDNIPLPHGRSLNSCKNAFSHMTRPNSTASAAPIGPGTGPGIGPGPTQPPAPVSTSISTSKSVSALPSTPAAPPILSSAPSHQPQHHHQPNPPQHPPSHPLQDPRKRPLPPIPTPRAIQPKPPSNAYAPEPPAPLSPRWSAIGPGGEPPRKRGRPSKAETERRRAAAQARGETYPPPRRSTSNRTRPGSGSGSIFGQSIPPSPTSPDSTSTSASAAAAAGVPMGYSNQTPSSAPPAGLMPASVPYDVQIPRMPGSGGSLGSLSMSSPIHQPGSSSGPRDIPRAMNLRELPRPDMNAHPLPSPHALQLGLGPPDAFRSRLNSAGERMFMGGPLHTTLSSPGPGSVSGAAHSDRFSPGERRDSAASASASAGGVREREMGGSFSDLRNSSTPGESR